MITRVASFIATGALVACSGADVGEDAELGEPIESTGAADTSQSLTSHGGNVYSVALGAVLQRSAPEGLYIYGTFSASRPTIIYVHGAIGDVNHAPQPPNFPAWQSAGFNTVFMRWHIAATDGGAGCPGGNGWFGIPNTPCNAEARIFGERGSDASANYAGERFVHAFTHWFGQYGSTGEIRVVAHSLGSQMASYLTYRLYAAGWGGPKPVRIDLLDPFAGTNDPGTPHPHYVIPSDHEVGGGSCGSGNMRTGYCRLENTLAWLRNRPEGIGILTIRSSVSHRFTNDLHFVTPVVELLGSWAGMNDTQKHGAVVPWYMCRIGPVASATAECAANPGFADAIIVRGGSNQSVHDALAHRAVFNWRYYAAANPDLAQQGFVTPAQLLSHWRQWGANECRTAHPYFHVGRYRQLHGDIAPMSCPHAVQHYVNNGLREGRVGSWSGLPWQPVLGPRTNRWDLVHLGGTFTSGMPFIQRFETNSSTVHAHDDRMQY